MGMLMKSIAMKALDTSRGALGQGEWDIPEGTDTSKRMADTSFPGQSRLLSKALGVIPAI
ncbi:hypothetical protein D7X30_22640 [Corallococcus sp. AB011P]|nr:hypothetical protein D7X30_22640 [Corallococcus sp. AB011P]RKH91443.1 hypothetical protein D7Y21_02390 [Corallococcus sp. AB045]